MDDLDAARREEQAGVPVALPADAVGRSSPGLVALEYFSDAVHLPLVGGVYDDPVADVSFHGCLQVACVLSHSLPVRAGPIKSPEQEADRPARASWAVGRIAASR